MTQLRIGPANDERKQEFDYEGIKFILKAQDPYGHIKITCLKNNTTLSGSWTSFDEARKGAQAYAIRTFPKKEKKVTNAS